MCGVVLAWDALRERLDQIPVFAVDYDEESCAVYLDVSEAKAQGKPYPTGLGTAYERAFGIDGLEDCRAVNGVTIVRSARDLAEARILPGGNQIDWQSGVVPLFGSFSLRQRLKSGEEVTPLFFSSVDAQQAVSAAVPPGEPLPELRTFSLQQMVEDIVRGKIKNPSAIQFVAPTKSVLFTQSWREAESLPKNLNVRQAMLSLFDGTADARRSGSVFPS